MRQQDSSRETSHNGSFRKATLLAALILAGGTGWVAEGLFKSGGHNHRPKSPEQIGQDIDRDWAKLANQMEAIAHNTRNPGLIVNRSRANVTGGTGMAPEATVLTIKDGSYSQTGGSSGFIAKVVEQAKSPGSMAVPAHSSFSIKLYGDVAKAVPFKNFGNLSIQNRQVSTSSGQENQPSFYFSMDKDSGLDWSFSIQSDIAPSSATPTPGEHKESIDPLAVDSSVSKLTVDISQLLSESNMPPKPYFIPNI